MNSLAHSAPSIPPANLNLFISRTTGGSSATSGSLVPSLPLTHSADERERYIQELLGQNPDFQGYRTEQWLAILSERVDDPRAESCLLTYLETKFIQAAKNFWRDVQGKGYRGYRSIAYDFNDVNDIIQETHYQSSQPGTEEPFLIKRVKNKLVQKTKSDALHQLGERTIYLDFYQQIKTAILRAKDDTLVRSDYFLLCHTITAKGLTKALKNYTPTSSLSEKEITIALELVGLLKECYLPNHKGKRTKYPPPNQAELTSITNEYNSRIKKMGLDFPQLTVEKVSKYFELSLVAIRQKEPAMATNEYTDHIIPQSALEGEVTQPIEDSSSSQRNFQTFLEETLGNSEFRQNHATPFIRLFLHYGLGIEVKKIAPIQNVNRALEKIFYVITHIPHFLTFER